jgi:uncharacterized RDD family membrane protein YckC
VEDYQDRLVIATPEGVELALDLAGLGSRFTAGVIDLAIKAVIVIGVVLAALPLSGLAATLALTILPLLVYVGYDVLFETLGSGRTPGKRATGLRVLSADGGPEDGVSSLIRNVLRLIDGLPLSYVPGIVSILVTKKNQRVGDLAAGTIVVRERQGGRRAKERGAEPSFAVAAVAAPPAAEGEREREPVATLAPSAYDLGGLTDADASAVRAFLDRRDRLDTAARDDVATRLAEALRPKVAGPFDDLPPERFLEALDAARRG